MVGSETGTSSRTVIARSTHYGHPVPLRILGDGVNRLFGLILSLVSAKGGVLLVDEIETGFHYSIMPDVWKTVFRVAADLDIQVFATTHSWDCIEAFQEAAIEHPEDGVLARLTVKGDRVIPTIFREEDLEIITWERIEVR
jgi:predicted ATPase